MIIELLWQNPPIFLVWVLAIIFAITIHEFSHALLGYLLGDNTAKDQGRLTLNPLSHLDMFGLLLLLIAGFGWGKPVPFNPYNLKIKRWGPALVAAAGPISNLVAIIIFGVALKIIASFSGLAADNLLILFLVFLIQINMVLMIFNLLPIPPLDGSKILFSVLPRSAVNIKIMLQRYGPTIILSLILIDRLLGLSYFARFFNIIYQFIINIIF
ncbi:site-2 protease family protein [Patescibacteria group bacterium]|nr:site-2 protease family protein [Patescibacteria group bacterium]